MLTGWAVVSEPLNNARVLGICHGRAPRFAATAFGSDRLEFGSKV
jgi:hypothetical protein